MKKYQPDTIEDLKQTDLIKIARELLGATVESTKALNESIKVTPARVHELRIVLGFLNATIKACQAKMQFFKMTGMKEKIDAVKKGTKK